MESLDFPIWAENCAQSGKPGAAAHARALGLPQEESPGVHMLKLQDCPEWDNYKIFFTIYIKNHFTSQGY